MDLEYTYELDLNIENGEFQLQKNGEATTISAFFTDCRHSEQRGYWLDILSSDLWKYDQARITDDTITNIQEVADEISKKIVEDGIYDKLDAEVRTEGMYIILYLHGYNNNNIVFNRKFRI